MDTNEKADNTEEQQEVPAAPKTKKVVLLQSLLGGVAGHWFPRQGDVIEVPMRDAVLLIRQRIADAYVEAAVAPEVETAEAPKPRVRPKRPAKKATAAKTAKALTVEDDETSTQE